MDTDKHRLIHEEETRLIIGSAIEVLNTLGHGLLEKPYENALVVEKITDHEIGQVLNYLKITRLNLGLILNFRRARLEWKRVVL